MAGYAIRPVEPDRQTSPIPALAEHPIDGERQFLMAIVAQAVEDVSEFPGHGVVVHQSMENDLRDAISWMFHPQAPRHFTAFLSICENLRLDPEMIRQRVRRMLYGKGFTVEMLLSGNPLQYSSRPRR